MARIRFLGSACCTQVTSGVLQVVAVVATATIVVSVPRRNDDPGCRRTIAKLDEAPFHDPDGGSLADASAAWSRSEARSSAPNGAGSGPSF